MNEHCIHSWPDATCAMCGARAGDVLSNRRGRIVELEAELTVQTDRAEGRLHRIDALEAELAISKDVGRILLQETKDLKAERDAAVAKLEKSVKREEVRTRVDTEKMVRMAARLTRLERVAEKAREWLLQLPSPLDERPYRKSVVDALRALDPGKEE